MTKYEEGDWFLVPLADGRQLPGLIVRKGRSKVLFGYFFNPHGLEVSDVKSLDQLSPQDAVLVGKFSHLSLQKGDWKILGKHADWSKRPWSLPRFVRREEGSGRVFLASYADTDPNKLLGEVRVGPDEVPPGTPEDGLMGAVYVERWLARWVPRGD